MRRQPGHRAAAGRHRVVLIGDQCLQRRAAHLGLLSDEPEGVPLKPGDYALTANGVAPERAVVRAPEGFTN